MIKITKIKVANIKDIEKGKVSQVKVGDELVALYHTDDDKWYATSDICSHEFCQLSEGENMLQGNEMECHCHGSKFDVTSGACLLPPAVEPLKTYKVSVEGANVFIEA